MSDTNERIARMARMAERLREHAASVNDDECRDSWTQEAADIDWLIAKATAIPPVDAALADDLDAMTVDDSNRLDVFQKRKLHRAAAALRARAVPDGYSIVPTLILKRMKRAVDDTEKMATEGMHLSGAKVAVPITDIKSMLLAASKENAP